MLVYPAQMKIHTMFEKDDHVVYPIHGVGVIADISTEVIRKKRQKYYIVDLINIKMRVKVPVDKAEEIGLRHIVNKRQVNKVLKLLKQDYVDQEEDWKIRYQNNLAKVKSGSIMAVAEVCRNLYKRARDKELSTIERKLYELAYSLIVNEIALAKKIEVEEASNLISDSLSR